MRCSGAALRPGRIRARRRVTEPVIDEDADRVCDRFLRRIGYVGICEIEMKRDTRDGRVKLIEANPAALRRRRCRTLRRSRSAAGSTTST